MIKPKANPCKNPDNTEVNKLCFYFSKKYGCKECHRKAKAKEDKSPIKKRAKAIKKVSDKRARQNQLYSVARRLFLEQNPNCAVYPSEKATEVHHISGRRGEKLLDTTDWLAVSRRGHNWIHANPEEAEKKGWLKQGRNSK